MNRDPRRRGSRFRVAARGAIPRAKNHVSCSVAKHDRRRRGPRFVPPPRGDPLRYTSCLATDVRPVSWAMCNRALRELIAGASRAERHVDRAIAAGGALVGPRVGTLPPLDTNCWQLGDDSAWSRQQPGLATARDPCSGSPVHVVDFDRYRLRLSLECPLVGTDERTRRAFDVYSAELVRDDQTTCATANVLRPHRRPGRRSCSRRGGDRQRVPRESVP